MTMSELGERFATAQVDVKTLSGTPADDAKQRYVDTVDRLLGR